MSILRAMFGATILLGCQGYSRELPGSASFPVVDGSNLDECPSDAQLEGAVCVSMPNNAHGNEIVEAYQRALDERGFRFKQYFEGRGMVLLTRRDDNNCEVMMFGLPYLPPEERPVKLLLIFHIWQAPDSDFCEAA